MEIEELETNIGYRFNNIQLLKNALVHKSYSNEKKNVLSDERLEFLGDAVLELTISEYLYKNYFNFPEGEMTKIRASVVCEEALFKVAKENNLAQYLLVGKCEEISGGKYRASLLSDTVEAIIGAIYLDGGYQNSREFILNNLKDEIKSSIKGRGIKDYKTLLQEKLQINGSVNIKYNIVSETGPDHNKVFESKVECNGKILGTGIGKNKKSSEMMAAKNALENLN